MLKLQVKKIILKFSKTNKMSKPMKYTRKKMSPQMEQQISNYTQQNGQQQSQVANYNQPQQHLYQQVQQQPQYQPQYQQPQPQQQQPQYQQPQPQYQQQQPQYQQPQQAQYQTQQQQTQYQQQQPQYQQQQTQYQPQQSFQRTPQENQNILVAIMTAQSYRAKCRSCQTILQNNNNGDYKKCRCGKVAIDGGKNTNSRRLIGSLDDIDLA